MIDHLAVIAGESDRFVTAIRQADPSAPVPTCPDWTADDLLWHVTEVHGFWSRILATGALTDADSEACEADKPPRPADRDATIDLLIAETGDLLAQLTRLDASDAAWSWFGPDQTVGFTRRMQVHEAVMHRIDAELTAGLATASIVNEVAADGIAHAVEVMLAWWGTVPGFTFTPAAGVVELTATDPGRSWLLQPGRWQGVGESGKEYDVPGVIFAGEGEPKAHLRGTTEQLDRWLWGRGEEPEASGDAESLDAVRAAQSQGMN